MGKKKRVIDYKTVQLFRKLKDEGKTIRQICEETGSSSVTVLKYLKEDVTADSIRILALEDKIKQMDQDLKLVLDDMLKRQFQPVKSKPLPIPKDIPISNDINPDDGEWITLDEAIKLSYLSRPRLSILCHDKRIQAIKKSKGGQGKGQNAKSWIINKESLMEYIDKS